MVVLGDVGVLITGRSGSGKSQLALDLLRGTPGWLVADDQVYLSSRGGRLVAQAPGSIAGLIEARGFGPAPVGSLTQAVVDLVVTLEPDDAPRVADGETVAIGGVAVPLLRLGARDTRAAAAAVRARLGFPPFVG